MFPNVSDLRRLQHLGQADKQPLHCRQQTAAAAAAAGEVQKIVLPSVSDLSRLRNISVGLIRAPA
jgi:hypothetical protein